jgi:hypothetical protein
VIVEQLKNQMLTFPAFVEILAANGYVIVPTEPTKEMITGPDWEMEHWEIELWKNMLKRRPTLTS